jgi:cytochrome b
VGSRHARFASFRATPRAGLRYLAEVLRGQPRRYLGHNPAGALMVFALLADLAILLLSGILLQATLEFEGPLVDLLRGLDDAAVHRLLSLHRLAVNGLYVLAPLHLLGVALASFQHRENLVRAMVTGYKFTTTKR